MKPNDLKDWIDSLTQDIEFEYQGVHGAICPFTRSNIVLSWGDKQQDFTSVEAVMDEPFFEGKSLAEISMRLEV